MQQKTNKLTLEQTLQENYEVINIDDLRILAVAILDPVYRLNGLNYIFGDTEFIKKHADVLESGANHYQLKANYTPTVGKTRFAELSVTRSHGLFGILREHVLKLTYFPTTGEKGYKVDYEKPLDMFTVALDDAVTRYISHKKQELKAT